VKRRLRQAAGAVVDAAQEGLELLGLGRLSMDRHTPFKLVHEAADFALRRYAAQPGHPLVEDPILLVPTLALSADTFDLDPELSVVGFLTRQGIDTWVVDFGRPEDEAGGLERTYERYVRAVEEAIELVRANVGRDVHLLGHSQGGVLAYQAAALRRREGLASVITLGTPVDFHRSLRFDPDLSARLLPLLRNAALASLRKLDALPAHVSQRLISLASLDARLMSRRKAEHRGREWPLPGLGASSFVSIPGPTLSSLTDELLLNNRLMRGGFVLGSRVASLSDIASPVLYFVGERDDLAPADSVRAIRSAAPHARETYEVSVPTGHLGLVLSRRAFELTWPSVVAWMRFREGSGPLPAQLAAQQGARSVPPMPRFNVDVGLSLMRDASLGVVASTRRGVSTLARESLRLVESFLYQVSRLATVERIADDSRVSFGALLDERAAETPDASWFIYEGRGQSYAEANRRVDHVVRGLYACGVRRGHKVGVLMNSRPSYLSLVTALSRLGAVAVLLSPGSDRASLAEARCRLSLDALVADPENVEAARNEFPGKLLMLGAPRSARPELPGLVDMETIETDAVELPANLQRNPGLAHELAMILFTAGADGSVRLGYVTNRRFMEIAYTTAALLVLGPKDTIYASTPMHHAMGIAMCVGGALAGGARVALSTAFIPERFWPDVRRYGVTVLFYAGDMLRELLFLPGTRGERETPLRILAGTGMRSDTARRLRERFGVARLLEFYAVVDGASLLVNANAKKPSALGRPLGPLERAPLLAAFSFERGEVLRDAGGLCIEAADDEPGVLMYTLDGQTANRIRRGEDRRRIEVDVRVPGDLFGFSGDVMRRDPQGEFWLLDRVDDVLHTPTGLVFTLPVEDVFLSIKDVRAAAVIADPRVPPEPTARPPILAGKWAGSMVCALVLRSGRALDIGALSGVCRQRLSVDRRPACICVVSQIPLTDGGRTRRVALAEAVARGEVLMEFVYDAVRAEYVRAGDELRSEAPTA
jgi:putative long chain acyl-CoA synthase